MSLPRWRGQPMAGTLLLDGGTEGMGDTLMGVRFAAEARQRVGCVVVLCHRSMVGLMSRVAGVDVVAARPEGACDIIPGDDIPPFEAWSGVLDLGIALRTTPATWGGDRPYLTPDFAAVERWRPTVEAIPGFRVGISWQGNPQGTNDARRSFRLADLAPLAAIPGVSLISLQKGAGVEQLAGAPFRVHDLGELYHAGDWDDTAAVASMLDLVVNPCSSIAHLAGGLGRPVWIAISRPFDWRWGMEGDTTPWYSSARLFRQDRAGEWAGVFRRMAEALGGA